MAASSGQAAFRRGGGREQASMEAGAPGGQRRFRRGSEINCNTARAEAVVRAIVAC